MNRFRRNIAALSLASVATQPLAFAAVERQKTANSATPPGPRAQPIRLVCDRVIDDFSSDQIGSFPSGWGTRKDKHKARAEARGDYVVEDVDGERVLRARYKGSAITIGRPVPNWDLERYPFLQWRWKAISLPVGGNEKHRRSNDSAAGIYAIWKVGFPFHIDGIKYAWSTTLSEGSRYSKRFGHDQLLVVESGKTSDASWKTERVNVLKDHREFFDRESPRSPAGIALLTDADATNSSAEALYADFRLCRLVE